MTTARRTHPAALSKRRVLDAALTVFAERGYRSTSLKVVANELGVTRQALYYHVASKGQILTELLDQMMTMLEEAVGRSRSDSQAPKFADLLRNHARTAAQHRTLVGLLLHEQPELSRLPSATAQEQRRRAYLQVFLDTFEREAAAGWLKPADSWITVNSVLSATTALSSWYRGSANSWDVDDIADEIVGLLAWGGRGPD
jgi:AcrR family transcriptional regulator